MNENKAASVQKAMKKELGGDYSTSLVENIYTLIGICQSLRLENSLLVGDIEELRQAQSKIGEMFGEELRKFHDELGALFDRAGVSEQCEDGSKASVQQRLEALVVYAEDTAMALSEARRALDICIEREFKGRKF